jgi:hypothetical protein
MLMQSFAVQHAVGAMQVAPHVTWPPPHWQAPASQNEPLTPQSLALQQEAAGMHLLPQAF